MPDEQEKFIEEFRFFNSGSNTVDNTFNYFRQPYVEYAIDKASMRATTYLKTLPANLKKARSHIHRNLLKNQFSIPEYESSISDEAYEFQRYGNEGIHENDVKSLKRYLSLLNKSEELDREFDNDLGNIPRQF